MSVCCSVVYENIFLVRYELIVAVHVNDEVLLCQFEESKNVNEIYEINLGMY